MSNGVYDKRLAKMVFDNALKSKELNAWLSRLRKISDIVKDSAVSKLLKDPKIPFNDKAKVLTDRLGKMDPLALKLISKLLDKGRLDRMDNVTDEYQRLLDAYHGVEGAELAEITTAIPLEDKDKLDLAKRLTDIIGKPVVIKDTVDPELIGGIIIKIKGRLIDGSIRSKLRDLKGS
jgi:F-type H+-transporting ATPase subunit delta